MIRPHRHASIPTLISLRPIWRRLEVYIAAIGILAQKLRLARLSGAGHGGADVLVALVEDKLFLLESLALAYALLVRTGGEFVFQPATEFVKATEVVCLLRVGSWREVGCVG